jgi:hypothetical protein
MIIVHTISGSIYEFDHGLRRVRRLSGQEDPTPRQGKDGEWKSYNEVLLQWNGSLIVVWGYDEKANITKTTMLSPLAKIQFDKDIESNDRISKDALKQLLGFENENSVQ